MRQVTRQRRGLFSVMVFGCLCFGNAAFSDSETVIQAIIGKALSNKEVTRTVIYSDGSLEGVFNGISFAGEWRLEGGKYCREIHRGLNAAPACMDVAANRDSKGRVVSVIFSVNGTQSKFDVAN